MAEIDVLDGGSIFAPEFITIKLVSTETYGIHFVLRECQTDKNSVNTYCTYELPSLVNIMKIRDILKQFC